MRKLFLFPVLILLASNSAFSQDNQNLPKLEINPDLLVCNKDLDSVIQYTFNSPADSSLFSKWAYSYENNRSHQSIQYYWKRLTRDWVPRDKYEWEFDGSGRPVLQSHYDWLNPNGQWEGCDTEGCGKKEWAYDKNGNQILWTQSYYPLGRQWEVYEVHENIYDSYSNMVLDSKLEKLKDLTGENYWDGFKDEYSYASNGNMTGHVDYTWYENRPLSDKSYNDWHHNKKQEYEYDSTGNKTRNSYYNWQNVANEWYWGMDGQTFNRLEWQYDSLGRQKSVAAYAMGDSLMVYGENVYSDIGQVVCEYDISILFDDTYLRFSAVPPYLFYPTKKEYEFDADGKKISETISIWDWFGGDSIFYWPPFGVWNAPQKKEFEYNADNKIISEVNFNWNTDSLAWELASMTGYQYDTGGNIIEKSDYTWSTIVEDWQPLANEVWSFNQLALPTFHGVYNWTESTGEWIGDWKDEKSYDGSGRLILEAYYLWDSVSNNWIGREKYSRGGGAAGSPGKIEYGYDDSGNLTLYASYAWSNRRNAWRGYEVLRGKKEWEYDSNGRLFKETGYDWDNDLSDWIAKQRNVFLFDNMDDPIKQYQYAWEPESENWELIMWYHYYYSSATGINNIANNIKIFPNPSSGIINITGLSEPADVKLYSNEGQILKVENKIGTSIDISDLPAGVYILSISLKNGSNIKKTIIRM